MKRAIRFILALILLTASMAAAFWISRALPTSAMLALAAASMTVAAGAGLWRLWGKW